MNNIAAKLKNILLYGGLNKDNYHQVSPMVSKNNREVWKIISIFAFIMSGLSLLTGDAVESDVVRNVACIVVLALSTLSFIALQFFIKADQKVLINIIMYVELLMILIFGLVLGFTGNNLNTPAVTVMVLLVALPMFVTARPWITSLIVVFISLASCLLALLFEEGAVKSQDIYDSLMFGTIAILVHYFLVISKLRGLYAEYELKRLTVYDGLTGLENELSYVTFVEVVNKHINTKTQDEFAVMMCDVNGVKPVNDTYGHIYGCSLIVEGGHYLGNLFKYSRCFHVGGDEYIIVLQGEDYSNRDALIKTFEEKMDNYFITKDEIELRVSIAYGISCYLKGKDKEFATVLSRADKAMYDCKMKMKQKYNIASRKEM